MQSKAQPVIETVVRGRSVVEKLFNSLRITGFHNIKPFSAITITVSIPRPPSTPSSPPASAKLALIHGILQELKRPCH